MTINRADLITEFLGVFLQGFFGTVSPLIMTALTPHASKETCKHLQPKHALEYSLKSWPNKTPFQMRKIPVWCSG